MANKNTGKRAVVLVIGMLILLGGCCLVMVGLQPCSWLDLSLDYTGCIRQLDIGAHSHGTFARDLTMFGGATTNGTNIWRISDGRLLETLSGAGGVFSLDGTFFVIASRHNPDTISAWSTQDWTLRSTLDTDTRIVTEIAIAPDMSSLAVAGWNELVQVWQTRDGTLHTLKGHTDHVLSVAYSPDGTVLASGGADNTVRLWRVEDGVLLHTLKGHGTVVQKVVFSPDSQTLASASWDGIVRVWRTHNGAALFTFEGHSGYISDLAYSPDGSVLASAGYDGVVQLWDVNEGSRIGSLRDNWIRLHLLALAFSPDGKVLATARRYGPVRLYDVQRLLGEVTN